MTLTKTKSINHGNNQNNSNSYLNNSSHQECADCGSRNTQWASLNHGVIICDDCCLAHRNLGRCISVIKSLRKSYWPQSLIDTLYELVRKNSNQIWESNLSTVIEHNKSIAKMLKKPTPKDSHNSKLNFIRMKYENLAFISRSKYSSIEELNQQLINSVKTNDYEQTLRILAQGADANYRSQEDGNQPLHIASMNNQIGQIELLCLYGADLTSMNRLGQTPIDLAEQINASYLLERLYELQFELTDDLSFFLCNKRPDHKNKKQHFLIPPLVASNNPTNDSVLKLNLEKLPDHLFEELCKDIYDEMDRRQIESIWKSSVGPNLINEPIPFLIIKSCFSQTRNQLRQKLARFNSTEFSSLLIEILTETQRRYDLFLKSNNAEELQKDKRNNDEIIDKEVEQQQDYDDEDDDPLYDKVPSDEDYASVASESSLPTNMLNSKNKCNNIEIKNIDDEDDDSTPSFSNSPPPLKLTNLDKTLSPTASNNLNKLNQSIGLKSSNSLVANAESTLNSIINSLNQIDYNTNTTNGNNSNNPTVAEKDILNELKSENELMQAMIERLMEENAQLRADKMLLSTTSLGGFRSMETSCLAGTATSVNNQNIDKECVNVEIMALSSTFQQKINNNFSNSDELNLYSTVNSHKKLELMREKFYLSPNHSNNNNNFNYEYFEQQQQQLNESFNNHEHDDFANDENEELNLDSNARNLLENQLKIVEEDNTTKKGLNYQDMNFEDEKNSTSKSPVKSNNQNNNQMPSKNSVIKKMKKITKSVQDLFKATKESEFHMLKDLCDKVNTSVHEMIILFPENMESSSIKENLIQLNETCKNLVELVNGYHTKISTNLETTSAIKSPNKVSLSTSSSSSSALSNELATSQQMQDNILLKNMIISNLVNYSYEIAHTVKRIVCIMGADN